MSPKLRLIFEGETKKRFTNFIQTLYMNKGNAKGVILHITEDRIQVIYSYLDSDEERNQLGSENNYYNYQPGENPYFHFIYYFESKGEKNYEGKEIEGNYFDDDNLLSLCIRMSVDGLQIMYQKAVTEGKLFDYFILKARTIKTNGVNAKQQFLVQLDKNILGACSWKFIDVFSSKRRYKMINPINDNIQLNSIICESELANFDTLKEIVDTCLGKAKSARKKLSDFLIWIHLDYNDETNPTCLVLYFYININDYYSFELHFNEVNQVAFDAYTRIYKISLLKLANLIKNLQSNSFNFFKIIFLNDEIVLRTNAYSELNKRIPKFDNEPHSTMSVRLIPDFDSFSDFNSCYEDIINVNNLV